MEEVSFLIDELRRRKQGVVIIAFIHSFFKIILTKYLSDLHFPGPILDAGDIRSNKTDKNPCPHGVFVGAREPGRGEGR